MPVNNGISSSLPLMLRVGVIAGTLATLIQILLWLTFTDQFPAILYRDARLTAALVLGRSVLPPPATFDFGVMLVATVIHFTLSIAYAAALTTLAARQGIVKALVSGISFGVVLYIVNLYGFTSIFPWFVQARGWITLLAHIVFGVIAIWSYRWLNISNAQSPADVH